MEKKKIEGHLIKGNSSLSSDDITLLREKFLSNYARNKGWDKSNLSPDQMLEIVNQKGYKNPGMILG